MPERIGLIKEEGVEIGEDFDCGYYVILRKNVKVGDNVKIWSHVTVDPDAKLGNNLRIHNHCYICQGAIIEDEVFLAPGAILCNDKYPVRTDPSFWEPPTIKKGARICAGAIIMPGVTIGEKAIIGAGAVVLKDVEPGQIWVGNPARRIR